MTQLTAAEKLLQELGISEPEEIDLDAVAWYVGVTVKRRLLDGCEARIVGAGNKAIITVNTASAFVRQRFSIGHEIGHWYNHRGRTLICRSEDIGGHGNAHICLERQADAFAGDLLMPGYIFHPYIGQFRALTFDAVRLLARAFNASISATAIRVVKQGMWPAILVCHGQMGRKWFVRNSSVPESWFPKDELSIDSHAFGLVFGRDSDQARPRSVGAHIWFNRWDAERYEIQEQSVRVTDGEVLTLLLIPEIRDNKRG